MRKTIFEEMDGTYIRHGDYGTVKGRKSDGMGSENDQDTSVCKVDCG